MHAFSFFQGIKISAFVFCFILLSGCTPLQNDDSSTLENTADHQAEFQEMYTSTHQHIFDTYNSWSEFILPPENYEYNGDLNVNFDSSLGEEYKVDIDMSGQSTSTAPSNIDEVAFSTQTQLSLLGNIPTPIGNIGSANFDIQLAAQAGKIFFSLLDGQINTPDNTPLLSLSPLLANTYLMPISEVLLKMGLTVEEVNTSLAQAKMQLDIQRETKEQWKDLQIFEYQSFKGKENETSRFEVSLTPQAVEFITTQLNTQTQEEGTSLSPQDYLFTGEVAFKESDHTYFEVDGTFKNLSTQKETQVSIKNNGDNIDATFHDQIANQLILRITKTKERFSLVAPEDFSIEAEKKEDAYIGTFTDLETSLIVANFSLTFEDNISGIIELPEVATTINIKKMNIQIPGTSNITIDVSTPIGSGNLTYNLEVESKKQLNISMPEEGKSSTEFLNAIMQISFSALSLVQGTSLPSLE